MGVGGGVQDDAVDVTYSTKTGMEGGLGAAAALGQTTTTTQYGLSQGEGQIIQGEGQIIQGEGQIIQGEGCRISHGSWRRSSRRCC